MVGSGETASRSPKSERLENLAWQSSENLEVGDCNLCGGKDVRSLVVENKLPIVRCESCGLVYVNPRPRLKALKDFYDQYFPEESQALWQVQMDRVFRREGLARIMRYRRGGKILDVGCGYGFFLQLMRDNGWEAEGVEIAGEAIGFVRRELKLKVHARPLGEAKLPSRSFDVVTMWYFLRHVRNPREELREAHRALRDNGLLIVRVPNCNIAIDRLLARLGSWGERFFLINPPRHLFDYNAGTMRRMLEKSGFTRIEIANSIPRATGTKLEIIRRHLWYWGAQILFFLSGKRIIRGSSITVYARRKKQEERE